MIAKRHRADGARRPSGRARWRPALWAALLCAGCLPLAATNRDRDPAACASQGGRIERVCRAQRPLCVIPYPDAGRPCRDGAECVGACLATRGGRQGDPAQGRCEPDNNPCGCRFYVEASRLAGGVCAD